MTQGKPRWEDAPDWAMWGAIGWNETTVWFEFRPDGSGSFWRVIKGRSSISGGAGRRPENWRETLEPRPTADDGAVTDVIDLMNSHKDTWRDMPEAYWFQRLVGELGELGCSLANDHEHPPEWELKQIAAICLNWLDMRLTFTPVKPEPVPLLCPVCGDEIEVDVDRCRYIIDHCASTECVLEGALIKGKSIEDAEARLREAQS